MSRRIDGIIKRRMNASALLYSVTLLLLIGFFLSQFRLSTGVTLDRLTNAHIHFQSALYLKSLEQVARICLAAQILQGHFVIDAGYRGGFEAVGGEVLLYIEALNRRTGQILRSTKSFTISK